VSKSVAIITGASQGIGNAAVGTINAAIIALAKAFSDWGIEDGIQINGVLSGPVMTGRRRFVLAALGSPAQHAR
jgi:NAD(P)-dependent dehydrogenase (short-subunit alcohol dehydrogenase family)